MMKLPKTCLGIYAGVLTMAFAAVVLMGAKSSGPANFDTINVHRINVREPDGTLRMVISDKEKFPGLILHGKEYAHPRPRAGMVFYNDEATEQGGFIFSGKKNKDGHVSSGLSLTFDRYDQDQQLQLIGLDQGKRGYFSGLRINDVPAYPIIHSVKLQKKLAGKPAGERRAAMQAYRKKHGSITRRLFVGKAPSGNAAVVLKDGQGKARLALQVTPDGQAEIVFLNDQGKITRKLTADDLAKK